MKTVVTNKNENIEINETGKHIVDTLMFNFNVCPSVEFHKIILDFYFYNNKGNDIYDRQILKNNEKIYELMRDFYEDTPQFSVQFFSCFINNKVLEKPKSIFFIDLEMSYKDEDNNISFRKLFYDILLKLVIHQVKILNGNNISSEDIIDFMEDLDNKLNRLNEENNVIEIRNNIKYIDCKNTLNAILEDEFLKLVKEIFVRLFINRFYQVLKDNSQLKAKTLKVFSNLNNLQTETLGSIKIKSFKWLSKKVTIDDFYQKMIEYEFISENTDTNVFHNCFNETEIMNKYLFKEKMLSQLIYIFHKLISCGYIKGSEKFPVLKFQRVIHVETTDNQISVLMNKIRNKEYPFHIKRKTYIDDLFSDLEK